MNWLWIRLLGQARSYMAVCFCDVAGSHLIRCYEHATTAHGRA